MSENPHLKQARADLKSARLVIKKADGLYRHLRIVLDHTWYEIMTFPEYLVYTGDMGTYVFSRLTDMFEFFRNKDGLVNPGYWAQKAEAIDKIDGIERFSGARFMRELGEYCDDNEIDKETRKLLLGMVEPEHEYEALSEVSLILGSTPYCMDDIYGMGTEFTGRYIWCCAAIVWAINEYDKQKRRIRMHKAIQQLEAAYYSPLAHCAFETPLDAVEHALSSSIPIASLLTAVVSWARAGEYHAAAEALTAYAEHAQATDTEYRRMQNLGFAAPDCGYTKPDPRGEEYGYLKVNPFGTGFVVRKIKGVSTIWCCSFSNFEEFECFCRDML